MKQLKTNPLYRTYFVNGTIIYEIRNTTAPSTDVHAIIYSSGSSFPYLFFEDKEGNEHTYYLDSLIEDGDKLSSGAFSKTCHDVEGEPVKTPFEYFKTLCERQIANVITNNVGIKKYSDYYDPTNNVNKLSTLGVPNYMFKQNYDAIINSNTFKESNGSQVNSVPKSKVIDFTEEKYNQLIEDEILRRAKEAANSVANKFDKKVDTLTLINA